MVLILSPIAVPLNKLPTIQGLPGLAVVIKACFGWVFIFFSPCCFWKKTPYLKPFWQRRNTSMKRSPADSSHDESRQLSFGHCWRWQKRGTKTPGCHPGGDCHPGKGRGRRSNLGRFMAQTHNTNSSSLKWGCKPTVAVGRKEVLSVFFIKVASMASQHYTPEI